MKFPAMNQNLLFDWIPVLSIGSDWDRGIIESNLIMFFSFSRLYMFWRSKKFVWCSFRCNDFLLFVSLSIIEWTDLHINGLLLHHHLILPLSIIHRPIKLFLKQISNNVHRNSINLSIDMKVSLLLLEMNDRWIILVNPNFATRLYALKGYEIVFICDDSGSMKAPIGESFSYSFEAYSTIFAGEMNNPYQIQRTRCKISFVSNRSMIIVF